MRSYRNKTPKNIVVCMDGTGQGFGGGSYPTNVAKLYSMVEDRGQKQIAFYDSGVGARRLDLRGKVMGTGLSQKLCRAYEFILERFVSGDRIYLFGFSRGAATVALLAEFLHLFGVLPVGHRELIPKAYSIFDIKHPERRFREARSFVSRHHTMWCQVPFLGVWDTVLARGLPIQYIDQLPRLIGLVDLGYKHYRPDVPECVSSCCHALAIDDERRIFHPRIWSSRILPNQSLKQVWFSGMHTDVGGGYKSSALSDTSLEWMMKNAKSHGLLINERHGVCLVPNFDGWMEDSRSGVSRLYARKRRGWDSETHGNPQIHKSVLERRLNRNNKASPPYSPWILNSDYEVEH